MKGSVSNAGKTFALALSFAIGVAWCPWASAAEAYPQKPVRVVTAEPGGGTDTTLRMITPALSTVLGHQVIVDNRGGGGGVVAAELVARSAPDGYTLLYYTSSLWLAPFLRGKSSYDPVNSFSPVILIVNTPSVLVVHPSLPAQSVKELVALAKAKPGTLNYGAGGPGTGPHLMAELFKYLTAADIVYVPYKGVGLAITELVAGQVHIAFATSGAVAHYVKAGKLRALGVTSAQSSPLNPGLPAISATVPGYEAAALFGLFAPARTPPAIVNRLNAEINDVLARPDIKEKFAAAGIVTAGGSPEQFASIIKLEMERMGKVIKATGIRAE